MPEAKQQWLRVHLNANMMGSGGGGSGAHGGQGGCGEGAVGWGGRPRKSGLKKGGGGPRQSGLKRGMVLVWPSWTWKPEWKGL